MYTLVEVLMPWIVVVPVEPWLIRLVTPVALLRSTTDPVPVLVKLTVSILASLVGVTLAVITAVNESVPAPHPTGRRN